MSGFNKRSRLSAPTGKSGVPPKDKESPQSSSGADGQQKPPSKKLQWSMGDLLTKLDSGDATGASVEEAMAQARAGEDNESASAPIQPAKQKPAIPATA